MSKTDYHSVELEKDLANKLCLYLKEQEITYEISQSGGLVHFEIYVENPVVLKMINYKLSKLEISA